MIIFGIDPGVERLGFSFFEKKGTNYTKYLYSGLIKTSKNISHARRLQSIYQELEALIKKYKPSKLVLESIFTFKNQKTVVQVAHVQGVILTLAAKHGIDPVFLSPVQIKQIVTGFGRSDKKSVQKMLTLLLKLSSELKQDDQADAIACAYTYCCMNDRLI